jgi:hypothetical protein
LSWVVGRAAATRVYAEVRGEKRSAAGYYATLLLKVQISSSERLPVLSRYLMRRQAPLELVVVKRRRIGGRCRDGSERNSRGGDRDCSSHRWVVLPSRLGLPESDSHHGRHHERSHGGQSGETVERHTFSSHAGDQPIALGAWPLSLFGPATFMLDPSLGMPPDAMELTEPSAASLLLHRLLTAVG